MDIAASSPQRNAAAPSFACAIRHARESLPFCNHPIRRLPATIELLLASLLAHVAGVRPLYARRYAAPIGDSHT